MRAVPVAALALVALAISCKTYKDEGEVLPPGYEAGVYTPPPDRQVYDDGGAIKGGGGGLGGMGVLNNDGGNPALRDGPSSGGMDLGGGPSFDAGGGDGGSACDLLMQGCGPNMGCYPAAAGTGRCSRTDPGSPEGAQCIEPANCAPGLSCVSMLCTALCSTAMPGCSGAKRCVPLPATDGVGYCLP